MTLKAIGFDLFGTLLQAKGDQTACLNSMHTTLRHHGFNIPLDRFLETYHSVHAGNREIRADTQREISNRAELSQILKQLGYSIDADAPPIPEAVSAYFTPWTVTAVEDARPVLRNLRRLRTGVATNFTDQAFVYKNLKDHGLLGLLDCVVVSAEVGWRKPHAKVFSRFKELIGARADETLFVGDDVGSDIAGAKAAGMTAVLVAGESHKKEGGNLVQPDYTITSVKELNAVIREIEER